MPGCLLLFMPKLFFQGSNSYKQDIMYWKGERAISPYRQSFGSGSRFGHKQGSVILKYRFNDMFTGGDALHTGEGVGV